LRRWQGENISEQEAAAAILPDLDRELEALEADIENQGKDSWSARLKRINENVARRVPAERALIRQHPSAVMRKLSIVPPILYWRWLGKRRVDPVFRFLHRAVESVRWRGRRLAVKYNLPFFLLTHYQAIAGEVFDGLRRLIEDARLHHPWYVHLHVMDLHDCFAQNRPLHALAKLRYLPRILRARRAGLTRRHVLYDMALCYVDAQIGNLMLSLEAAGQLDDTDIIVTADHGSFYAASPRPKRDIGLRTNYEDIEIPVLICGRKAPESVRLVDTMGVTATLLDLCGVAPHPSFKGVSAFAGGRDAVITESAGSGNADLERRDLYFTITTLGHRMMTILEGDKLRVFGLYDRSIDSEELTNLSDDPAMRDTIADLLGKLFDERGELLEFRGVSAETILNGWRESAGDAVSVKAVN
jgi:hypothetical protein